MDNKIQILIIEDEPIIARNLEQILTLGRYRVIGISYDPVDAYDKLAKQNVDLVLLDINLNGQFEGLEIAQTIYKTYKIPFIFITSYADESILEKAKQYMPAGYIIKPFDENEIYANIKIAWYNYTKRYRNRITIAELNEHLQTPLTNKEFEIVMSLIKGKTYSQIAQDHFISINTVNSHIKSIYSKMGIHNKVGVIKFIETLR